MLHKDPNIKQNITILEGPKQRDDAAHREQFVKNKGILVYTKK